MGNMIKQYAYSGSRSEIDRTSDSKLKSASVVLKSVLESTSISDDTSLLGSTFQLF